VSEENVAAVEVGSDEEQPGRKAGSVDRKAGQFHESYNLTKVITFSVEIKCTFYY
jgi:hypothetical protein